MSAPLIGGFCRVFWRRLERSPYLVATEFPQYFRGLRQCYAPLRNVDSTENVNLNRLRNSLCAVLSLILLGIYYRFPIGHLSSDQTVWLVLKIMVVVFALGIGFQKLSEASLKPPKPSRAPKSGYADTARSA